MSKDGQARRARGDVTVYGSRVSFEDQLVEAYLNSNKRNGLSQANFSSSSIEDGRFIHSESVAMTQPPESQTTTPNPAEFVS